MTSLSWCVRRDGPGKHRAPAFPFTVRRDGPSGRIVPSAIDAGARRATTWVCPPALWGSLECLGSGSSYRQWPCVLPRLASGRSSTAQRSLVGSRIRRERQSPGPMFRSSGQKAVARTDSTGRFRLAPLDPGSVAVRIRRLGFEPQTFDVVLHASAVDSVSVTMEHTVQLLDAMRSDASLQRQLPGARRLLPPSREGRRLFRHPRRDRGASQRCPERCTSPGARRSGRYAAGRAAVCGSPAQPPRRTTVRRRSGSTDGGCAARKSTTFRRPMSKQWSCISARRQRLFSSPREPSSLAERWSSGREFPAFLAGIREHSLPVSTETRGHRKESGATPTRVAPLSFYFTASPNHGVGRGGRRSMP